MRRLPALLAAVAACAAFAASAATARASLLIQVDKSAQQMTVIVDGDPRYIWPVSTGQEGYDTPGGQYKPFRMEKDHHSDEWDNAPMPYSIFFTQQGHAIHGTNHKIDGQAHSHGCVRLSVNHAAVLWGLVKEQGMANVRVELYGDIPSSNLMARGNSADPASRYGGRNAQAYSDRIANDEPDYTGQLRPGPGVWREYREGGRVYFYRDGPDEEQRIYRHGRRPPPYYRNFGGPPFW